MRFCLIVCKYFPCFRALSHRKIFAEVWTQRSSKQSKNYAKVLYQFTCDWSTMFWMLRTSAGQPNWVIWLFSLFNNFLNICSMATVCNVHTYVCIYTLTWVNTKKCTQNVIQECLLIATFIRWISEKIN